MKEAKNSEIDLMLRSLARRERSTSEGHSQEGGPSAASQGQLHLDADELNSYAENALPAAARALYTEHLADCSSCRKVAAQLSLASGKTLHPISAETRKPWSLRGFLSGIFTIPFLRYAVPVFSLIAIMAVALMINRQKSSRHQLVAMNEPSSASSLNEKEQSKIDSGASSSEKRPAFQDRVKNDSGPTNTAAARDREQPKAEAKPLVDDSKNAKEPVREAKSSDAAAQPAAAPYVAEEPAPTKELPASDISENRALAKQKAQPEVERQAGASKKEADEPHNVDEISASRAAPKKTESLPVAGRGVQGIVSSASGRRPRTEKSDKDKAETRSVAGHRFSKEGSVWVDAAYDSSRPTVTLARGSEQYRALVADEPDIQTIADQLEGQIIIAWKGRTYKIR